MVGIYVGGGGPAGRILKALGLYSKRLNPSFGRDINQRLKRAAHGRGLHFGCWFYRIDPIILGLAVDARGNARFGEDVGLVLSYSLQILAILTGKSNL